MAEYEIEYEDIEIHEPAKYVFSSISNMGRGLIAREHLLNQFQATSSDEESVRHCFVEMIQTNDKNEPLQAPKLAFLNTTASGFLEDDLADIVSVGKSTKKLEADGGDNRGEGAKLAAARFNQEGIVWTSRKNGQLTRVVFRVRDNRFVLENYRDQQTGVSSRYYLCGDDLSEEDKERYARVPTGLDFFDVKLMGNRPDHDTFNNPYDEVSPTEDIILDEIVGRIADARCKIPTKLLYRDAVVQRTVVLFNDLVNSSPDAFEHDDTVVMDGMKIRYLLLKEGHPLFVNARHGGSRSALEYEGEHYDVLKGSEWAARAGLYGFRNLGRHLSVIVSLKNVHNDRDRAGLIDRQGAAVLFQDFVDLIHQQAPDWLKEKLESTSSSGDDSKMIKSECQAILDRALVANIRKDKNGNTPATGQEGGAKGNPRAPKKNTGEVHSSGNQQPEQTEHPPGNGSQTTAITGSVDLNSTQNTSRKLLAPDHMWVKPADLSSYGNLSDRGCLLQSNTYYLNESFFVLDVITEVVISKYFEAHATNSAAKGYIRSVVKSFCALQVGKYIARALSKKSDKTYNAKQINSALDAEALTMVFENCDSTEVYRYLYDKIKNAPGWRKVASRRAASTPPPAQQPAAIVAAA